VPVREVSGWDIVANAIGVAIGTSFYYVRRRFLV